ncbi:unnamed protein product (macronuclear) [Paramecium tetraurelia]|uniref:PPM-type phosphatase domain-containing protein n=1 Tax=Paramecium tetraurelia TaxID=5888 RepID=A0CHF7_PARTE|nr:uncharacterized protein GSPATT00038326001 [Paramecium tetraurelia]CAK70224.1 unnamed protein product [Paramecium tetraurelia]|eukprot:XP_001437621.1 hypothetical protein (macronuclear) [Paramecium tetraurelia strain d4-2]
MNPVEVFPLNLLSHNHNHITNNPVLVLHQQVRDKNKGQQYPSERFNIINMSTVINGQQQAKEQNATEQIFYCKQWDIGCQSENDTTIEVIFIVAKQLQKYIQVPSPTKLHNLKKAESTSSQNILQKIDIGLAQKRSKRTDASNEVTPSSRAQIIKLLQDTSPKQKANFSRAKMASQTVDQVTSIKPKMPQQMVMLLGRSTSQATLVNNLTNECEMQDYVQLFFSKSHSYKLRSQAGQNGNGQKKTNYDSVVITNNLGGVKNEYIFSVCDGHGVYGHYFIKNFIGKQEQDISEAYESEIQKVLNQSFIKMTKDLSNSGIDITFSGTTCSLVLVSGLHLQCANIGDSRSVNGIDNNNQILQNNKILIMELSNDYKPDLPSKFERIIQIVEELSHILQKLEKKLVQQEFWLQHEQIPGLALSRSFGDYGASTVRVSSEPEIIHYKMESNYAFLVVASDGVWEFFSNEKIQKLLYPIRIDDICEIIVRESTKRWQEEDEVIDDISIVIAYLHRQ